MGKKDTGVPRANKREGVVTGGRSSEKRTSSTELSRVGGKEKKR